jgi:hypothetical protein
VDELKVFAPKRQLNLTQKRATDSGPHFAANKTRQLPPSMAGFRHFIYASH